MLWYVVAYCVVLCYGVVNSDVMLCVVLCCDVVCFDVFYCVLLCFVLLCYVALSYGVVLCCAVM